MERFKDFLYNKNDLIIAILILLAAAAVIFFRVKALMDYGVTSSALVEDVVRTASQWLTGA